jgi:hypothetical protein
MKWQLQPMECSSEGLSLTMRALMQTFSSYPIHTSMKNPIHQPRPPKQKTKLSKFKNTIKVLHAKSTPSSFFKPIINKTHAAKIRPQANSQAKLKSPIKPNQNPMQSYSSSSKCKHPMHPNLFNTFNVKN